MCPDSSTTPSGEGAELVRLGTCSVGTALYSHLKRGYWGRRDDDVVAVSGTPTWENLAGALQEIGHTAWYRCTHQRRYLTVFDSSKSGQVCLSPCMHPLSYTCPPFPGDGCKGVQLEDL